MQQLFAMTREFYQNFSLIQVTVPAANGAAFYKAVNEFDRAVMAEAKLLRERSNRGTAAFRQAFDCEKNLVLLRLDSLGAGRFFAEMQELPDTVTKLGKPPKAKF